MHTEMTLMMAQMRSRECTHGLLIQSMSALSDRDSSGPKSVTGWASTLELCFLLSMLKLALGGRYKTTVCNRSARSSHGAEAAAAAAASGIRAGRAGLSGWGRGPSPMAAQSAPCWFCTSICRTSEGHGESCRSPGLAFIRLPFAVGFAARATEDAQGSAAAAGGQCQGPYLQVASLSPPAASLSNSWAVFSGCSRGSCFSRPVCYCSATLCAPKYEIAK